MPKIVETLAAAVKHHQAGQLREAEQLYRQVLQTDPLNPDALHFLGLIAYQVGQHEVATEYVRRAIQQRPDAPSFHCSLAMVHSAAGRPEEAVASCRRALEIQPDYAPAHNNLGLALQTQGQLDEAVACYLRALEVKPDFVEALNNLAAAYQVQGKLDQAEETYRRAVELRPGYAEALSNLGNTLHQLGRLEDAAVAYRQALHVRPDYAEIHTYLGAVLQDQGKLDDAVASFRQALQQRADFPEALNNLGYALVELGRFDEAIGHFQRALELRPDYPEAHNNLGMALRGQGQRQQAAASLQKALELRPDFAEAHSNLGAILQSLGRHDEAVEHLQKALQAKPNMPAVLNNLGLVLEAQEKFEQALDCYRRLVEIQPGQPLWQLRRATLSCPDVLQSADEADRYRRQLEADIRRFSETAWRIALASLPIVASKPPFSLMYHGRDDRPIKEAYAAMFRGCFPQSSPPSPPPGRPRIGLLVTEGHEEGFLRCMAHVLERLDAQRFEPVVICSSAGSALIRSRIPSESIRLLTMPERFDQIIEALRAAMLHLLYYWEVGSDTINYFLPFFRLAPVQCTSWGLPVTTGIPEVDYYLSDELVEAEDADGHYCERLICARTLLTYQPRLVLPEGPRQREDFGFTAEKHLYVCAQSVRKLHPDFDPVLAQILDRDPQGVVVLVEDKHGDAAGRLRRRLASSIPAALERVAFLPRLPYSDYLCLLAAADVLLDPLHYGGAVTAYDGFSFDRPIVTLPTPYRRGRFVLGCYRKMGFLDLVATDAADYVEKAVRLGTDAEYRASAIEQIAAATAVLFDDPQAVAEYERIFAELLAQEGIS